MEMLVRDSGVGPGLRSFTGAQLESECGFWDTLGEIPAPVTAYSRAEQPVKALRLLAAG